MAEGEGTPAEKSGMILKDVSMLPQPRFDGDINMYCHPEAVTQPEYFDDHRRVIFINGMKNSPTDHVVSAMALSFVQMCPVLGVYNKSVSGWKDFLQCIADKRQFNGPSTWMPFDLIKQKNLAANLVTHADAVEALSRNPAQVELFELLLRYRSAEIFAHSQGNLILSNALQALHAVYGLSGRVVHTFGSPAVHWPAGITKFEHGFTFDPVNWLSGFDETFTISKVGMPKGAGNPITHSFLEYLNNDPEFLVNRFRIGMFGATLNMDEQGLADCLLAMGSNLSRVAKIFEHLQENHTSDADDVAVLYVEGVMASQRLTSVVRGDATLRRLLIAILSDGAVFADERKAIEFLEGLSAGR